MRRVLLVIAVAIPAVVLAITAATGQVLELGTYSPVSGFSYINKAHCDGAGVHLQWNLEGATVVSTGSYQIYTSNTQPAVATGEVLKSCPERDATGGTGGDVLAGQVATATPVDELQDLDGVSASLMVTKAGQTCADASENKPVYVCVHYYEGITRKGTATATFMIQRLAPAAPTGVNVGPGPGSLDVSWTASTGGAAAADHYIAEATPADAAGNPVPGATPVASSSVNGNNVTISGLTDGQQYRVVVKAYSIGGNPSGPSEAKLGTPTQVDDFWEFYRRQPGATEEGGCGAGGAGPLGLLAVAGLLAVLRRRK